MNLMERIIKKVQPKQFEESAAERRFRASIYVDIWVPKTDDLEADRAKAEAIAEEYRKKVSLEAWVGGVAKYNPHDYHQPLDREI